MHNQENGVGVTQVGNLKPKQSIVIGGVEWVLRRDATDASMEFPHTRVNWLNAGCEPINNGQAYYCWIKGVILPSPGSVQNPIDVMYVGFHHQKIVMAPNSIAVADMDRMHVYVCNAIDFAGTFVNQFLGLGVETIAERETITPWPPTIDQSAVQPPPVVKPPKMDKVDKPEVDNGDNA